MSLSELSKSCASTEAKQASINLVPQVPIDLPDYLRFMYVAGRRACKDVKHAKRDIDAGT